VIPAAVMMKLATIGLSAEQAEAVADMLTEVESATEDKSSAAIALRRANDRDRKARERAKKNVASGADDQVTSQHRT
jgi:hypothetical protein